ncbi:MAG TPA: Hsp70 family protein, partial [Kofleriaceae bacterium]
AAIAADHPMARPTTVPGSAVPPPAPRRASSPKSPYQVTTPLPPDLRDPHRPPQSYPVISLEAPAPADADAIAAASAQTMVVATDHAAASTARGMMAAPSPLTTSRGFQAPVAPPPAPFAALAPPLPTPFAPGGQLPRGTFPGFEPAAPPVQSPAALYQQAQAIPTFPTAPVRPPPVLLEVTPRGVGIATVAGFCEELIRRNARVPTEARRMFSTSRDRQDLVRIVVVQGESRRLDNNTVIGDLVLAGLPPRPRGETSIEVIFALDASGVLNVQARDALTGAEQRATLTLTGDVPQEDVAASRDRLKQLKR